MNDAVGYADAVLALLAERVTLAAAARAPVRAAIADGVAGFADIELAAAEFAEHLASRIGDHAEALHYGDLFLACGNLRGNRRAIEHLQKEYLAVVPQLLRSFPAPVVEEVVEGLLEKLVLGPKPKLAQYAGRSRLRTWLKTVAIHAAQDRLRKREPQPSRDRRGHDGGGDGLGADEAGFVDALGVNAEGEYARWVSKEELRRAVLEALERLTPVQRTMLRALYVERLTLKELGAPEGLEPSTMFRRLQQIYKVIRAAVHDILQERLKLSPTQCDSLMRSMFSQMDLRLSQLLPA